MEEQKRTVSCDHWVSPLYLESTDVDTGISCFKAPLRKALILKEGEKSNFNEFCQIYSDISIPVLRSCLR